MNYQLSKSNARFSIDVVELFKIFLILWVRLLSFLKHSGNRYDFIRKSLILIGWASRILFQLTDAVASAVNRLQHNFSSPSKRDAFTQVIYRIRLKPFGNSPRITCIYLGHNKIGLVFLCHSHCYTLAPVFLNMFLAVVSIFDRVHYFS